MPAGSPLRRAFSPHQGRLCAFRRSVNIVPLETSSARLVSSPPLLSSGDVVPAGPPKWLPPRPPLTSNLPDTRTYVRFRRRRRVRSLDFQIRDPVSGRRVFLAG